MSSNRTESMEKHLIGQFQGKQILQAIIEALGEELDELEQAFSDLRDKRWIDTAEGAQLDGIGTIVNQPRQIADAIQIAFFGFQDQDNALGFEQGRFRDEWETYLQSVNLSDPEYRKMLWLKVFKDVSSGTAEDTIISTRRIFDCPYVVLSELGNAKITVGIGRMLDVNELAIARAVDLIVRAGGVGVKGMTMFEYENYFGFLGQPNAKGFDVGTFPDDIDVVF
jgi:hypothetical protein|nr:MAG TPA: Protein of unknown function (DUF2612) [Caudoviricetes sp.]